MKIRCKSESVNDGDRRQLMWLSIKKFIQEAYRKYLRQKNDVNLRTILHYKYVAVLERISANVFENKREIPEYYVNSNYYLL